MHLKPPMTPAGKVYSRASVEHDVVTIMGYLGVPRPKA